MVSTYGLTHIVLSVRGLARSSRVYERLVGARVIVLEKRPKPAGEHGGMVHFGFRLRRARDIAAADPGRRRR